MQSIWKHRRLGSQHINLGGHYRFIEVWKDSQETVKRPRRTLRRAAGTWSKRVLISGPEARFELLEEGEEEEG